MHAALDLPGIDPVPAVGELGLRQVMWYLAWQITRQVTGQVTRQIARQVNRVLRRNEVSRIYAWHHKTGKLPPRRSRPSVQRPRRRLSPVTLTSVPPFVEPVAGAMAVRCAGAAM